VVVVVVVVAVNLNPLRSEHLCIYALQNIFEQIEFIIKDRISRTIWFACISKI
jgi:hypothetical protein